MVNDLNEVRDYRNFNLKVLVLNCSSKATPRRTNKMGVKWEAVKRVINQYCWIEDETKKMETEDGFIYKKPFRICMAHYAPTYPLSYFLDKFKHLPGWEYKANSKAPINQLVNVYFINALKEEFCNRHASMWRTPGAEENTAGNKLQSEFHALNSALEAIEKGTSAPDATSQPYFDCLLPCAKEEKTQKDFIKKMRENELYKQIERYCKWLQNEKDRTDEMISRMVEEFNECLFMGEQDKNTYIKNIEDICYSTERKTNGIDLFLAGHIHAYDERKPNEVTEPEDKKFDFAILIAGKAIQEMGENTEIKGYIISNMECSDRTEKDEIVKEMPFEHKRL